LQVKYGMLESEQGQQLVFGGAALWDYSPLSRYNTAGGDTLHPLLQPTKDLLHLYIGHGGIDGLQAVLRLVSLEHRNAAGDTPVMYAVWRGQAKAVRALPAAGAHNTTRDRQGRSVIHTAAAAGAVACLGMLLAAGVPVSLRDRYAATALHQAARYSKEAATRTLLAAGADLEAVDEEGSTALHTCKA
jgi:hypothetical protein